jgi:SAM-dependent methyltransferase
MQVSITKKSVGQAPHEGNSVYLPSSNSAMGGLSGCGRLAETAWCIFRVNFARAAEAFDYTAEQLASIPAEANMGLSCGNPTAFAGLKLGEVAVDPGCGGGLDVFLAAAKVGPTGKAIGIDMTPEMLDRARRNAAKGANGKRITDVEFHLSTIEKMPLPDASVDCVISNCVINLAPDKHAVFHEIARSEPIMTGSPCCASC